MPLWISNPGLGLRALLCVLSYVAVCAMSTCVVLFTMLHKGTFKCAFFSFSFFLLAVELCNCPCDGLCCQVLDPRTRMVLFKMLNKGVFSEINGCLSTGKEVRRWDH